MEEKCEELKNLANRLCLNPALLLITPCLKTHDFFLSHSKDLFLNDCSCDYSDLKLKFSSLLGLSYNEFSDWEWMKHIKPINKHTECHLFLFTPFFQIIFPNDWLVKNNVNKTYNIQRQSEDQLPGLNNSRRLRLMTSCPLLALNISWNAGI